MVSNDCLPLTLILLILDINVVLDHLVVMGIFIAVYPRALASLALVAGPGGVKNRLVD